MRQLSGKPELGEQLVMNYRTADLSKKQRAMLDFSWLLTKQPEIIDEEHRETLRKAVLECVEESFNRITIDGDMSTNDTVLVLANGASGMTPVRRNGKRCRQFRKALLSIWSFR